MANGCAEGGEALRATADDLVAALRLATDTAAREALLEELLTVDAPPVIEGALNRRHASIGRGDRDDLRAQVLVRLLRRLARYDEQEKPIERFEDYVAIVTYHVVDDYVRTCNPQGAFAANRIRYVLRHDGRFATWESGGETVCGLAEWRGRPATDLESGAGRPTAIDGGVLARLFAESGGPLLLRAVIAHCTEPPGAPRAVTAADDAAFGAVAVRQLLVKLWQEILELPRPQRLALLLNLRDGPASGALSELPLAGVASVDAIAAALGWEGGELSAHWQELPFDDDRIAALLGVTRQQVINLRKAARARLARRLARMNV
ncbi:MAG TPA: hypothetical protein VGF28_06260 [Thermoanaerobaculia bacterium]|jgi:hypothetical protein